MYLCRGHMRPRENKKKISMGKVSNDLFKFQMIYLSLPYKMYSLPFSFMFIRRNCKYRKIIGLTKTDLWSHKKCIFWGGFTFSFYMMFHLSSSFCIWTKLKITTYKHRKMKKKKKSPKYRISDGLFIEMLPPLGNWVYSSP